jgi:uncharacterized protein YoaH (UPF0181 family)
MAGAGTAGLLSDAADPCARISRTSSSPHRTTSGDLGAVRNAEDYGEAQAWALMALAETLGAGLFAIADALEGIQEQMAQGGSQGDYASAVGAAVLGGRVQVIARRAGAVGHPVPPVTLSRLIGGDAVAVVHAAVRAEHLDQEPTRVRRAGPDGERSHVR